MDGAARNGSFCGEGRLRAERPLAGGESISASHCGRHALRGPVSRPDVRAHRAALIEPMSARQADGIGAKRALGGLPLASTGPAGPRGPVSASRIRGLGAVTGFTWGILPPSPPVSLSKRSRTGVLPLYRRPSVTSVEPAGRDQKLYPTRNRI